MSKAYIERPALMEKLTSSETQSAMRQMDGSQAYSFFLALVNSEPAADVVEVKHGRWAKERDHILNRNYWSCSECTQWAYGESNYCPNCGARMDLEDV